MGILNNVVPMSLIVWGQTHIASGLASILNATVPLFTVVIAHLLTPDEPMTGRRFAGVLVGFTGVAVMIGTASLERLGIDIAAQAAILVAAFSYGLSSVYGRRFRSLGVPPLATAVGQITASSLILLPLAILVDRPWTLDLPSSASLVSLLALALFSTALAYLLFFRILASAGATNVALVTFLIPVSAILFGTLFLQERLAPRHFAGMALIGCGLALIDGRLLTWLHARCPWPAIPTTRRRENQVRRRE
jgi:drug/metabolite transporter (DMT)-like permease